MAWIITVLIQVDSKTEFLGYEKLASDSTITHLYKDGKPTDSLSEGDEGVLILEQTPFYAESGGQVGELGEISTTTGVFEVLDTQKIWTSVHSSWRGQNGAN